MNIMGLIKKRKSVRTFDGRISDPGITIGEDTEYIAEVLI